MNPTLCVGCGANPEGDINIDAFPDNREQCLASWDPRKIKNFVLADASHLPFRDDVFDEVIARHTLEHLPEPLIALKEWKRVSKKRVAIWVPSQYIADRTVSHLYSWNKRTLGQLLALVFPKVKTQYTSWFYNGCERTAKQFILNIMTLLFRFKLEIQAICECEN